MPTWARKWYNIPEIPGPRNSKNRKFDVWGLYHSILRVIYLCIESYAIAHKSILEPTSIRKCLLLHKPNTSFCKDLQILTCYIGNYVFTPTGSYFQFNVLNKLQLFTSYDLYFGGDYLFILIVIQEDDKLMVDSGKIHGQWNIKDNSSTLVS